MGIPTINLQNFHILLCKGCQTPITLPRQSRLGTYRGLSYQPTGNWPTTVVCPRSGQAFSYSAVEDLSLLPRPMMDRMINLLEIERKDAPQPTEEQTAVYVHIGGVNLRQTVLDALGWPESTELTMTLLEW